MDIANLLAQGTRARPAGMEQNALMQGQEMQLRKTQMQNALMQMQDVHAQRQLALQETQRKIAEQQARDRFLQGLQPVSGAQANAASGMVGPTTAAAAAIGQRPRIDPAAAMRAGLTQEQITFLANSDTLGMPKVARTIERAGSGGAPETVQMDEFGRLVGGAIAKPVQLTMQNLGGRVQPVNPYTQVSPLTMTQSPDSVASNATTRRGQDMQDARARETLIQGSKPPTGYRWKADGTMEAIPGGPADTKVGGAGAKVQDATDAIALLNQAEPLLAGSTGSYGGKALDMLAQAFGASTDGSIKAQQLKAIEGALVAKMPKMSGPQSDKDVLLYRQMAAVIGDETVPYARKAAAVESVREIQERYAGMAPGASKPAANAVPTATNPKTGEKLQLVNGQWVPAK